MVSFTKKTAPKMTEAYSSVAESTGFIARLPGFES